MSGARQRVRHRSHALARAKRRLHTALGRLEHLNNRAERLIEAYNGETVKLAAARTRAAQTAALLREAERQVGLARQAVTLFALDSVQPLALPPEVEALTGTPESALQRASLVEHLGATQAATLKRLEDAEQVAAILRTAAAQAFADQEAAAARARVAKIQAQRAVARQVRQTRHLRRHKEHVARKLAAALSYVAGLRRRSLPVTGSGLGAQAARWALTQVGKPYVWAAAGPASYDCSGLTMRAWGEAGVPLDHWTGTQWTSGPHVPVDSLRPGDLVFFAYHPDDPSTIHHVGMYVGKGLMVHAPQTGDVVRVSSIHRGDLAGATRPG
ncbi:C40 family peptidase [Streptosporangiaceae bacterium NEAU-GS5]|nr:C40 family peptidase [Streptosporangiaceae bacterium NEAU-GS5]